MLKNLSYGIEYHTGLNKRKLRVNSAVKFYVMADWLCMSRAVFQAETEAGNLNRGTFLLPKSVAEKNALMAEERGSPPEPALTGCQ